MEWERLEFKAGWNPLDVLHTICAFANDFHNLGGGYIMVGVAEQDGRPVLPPAGVNASHLNAIQKELLSLGHSAMQPQYHPIVMPEIVDGRHVLVLWAPGGPTRPYSQTISASADEIEQLWAGKIIPDTIFSDPNRIDPHLHFDDYALTPTESAVSKDDGTAGAVESWIQKNGWHKELRSKLEAVGHEPPQRLDAGRT